MPPPAFLLEGLTASGAVEMGLPPGEQPWSQLIAPDAAVVFAGEHDGARPDPSDVRASLAAGVRVELVVDHVGPDHDVTRRRFESWFAALGPGGVYVIDGSIDDRLAPQLAMATIGGDVVERIWLDATTLAVWRTEQDYEGSRFVVADCFTDPFGLL